MHYQKIWTERAKGGGNTKEENASVDTPPRMCGGGNGTRSGSGYGMEGRNVDHPNPGARNPLLYAVDCTSHYEAYRLLAQISTRLDMDYRSVTESHQKLSG